MIRKKKGALELSVNTIVIIVIAITLLILGLVLVQNIFRGATESVKTLSQGVQDEITSLFVTEDSDIVIKLGSKKTAKIRPGTDNFGIAVGFRTADGSSVGNRARLQYMLSLDEASVNNCIDILGLAATEGLFITRLNEFNDMDEYEGSLAFALVQVMIPGGTARCTQKVFIDMMDNQNPAQNAGDFFILEIIREGFFF